MELKKVVVSGKLFKRKLQPYYTYVSPSGIIRTQLVGGMDRATVFTIEEILADDWELEEANATTNNVPSPLRQVETLVRQCATISHLCDIEIAEYTNETGEYPKCLHMPKSYLDKLKTEVAPYCETKVDEIDKYAGCEIYTDEIRERVRASA